MNRNQLMDLATGYWPAAALQAAIRLDLFPALAGAPRPVDELAPALRADASHLEPLLDALAGLSLLKKGSGGYSLAEGTRPWLDPASPDNLLDALRFNGDLYPLWGNLADCVRQGAPLIPPDAHLGRDPERTARFVRGMHSRARAFAPAITDALDLGGASTLLDIATGSGAFAAALADRHPGLAVTCLDLPAVLDTARDLHAGHPARDRLHWHPADYHSATLPAGFDAVLYCGALHQESQDEARALFRNIADSLTPGGRLFVIDLMTEGDGTQPVFSVLFGLTMALTRPHGHVYHVDAVGDLLQKAGFRDPHTEPIPDTPYHLVSAGI